MARVHQLHSRPSSGGCESAHLHLAYGERLVQAVGSREHEHLGAWDLRARQQRLGHQHSRKRSLTEYSLVRS